MFLQQQFIETSTLHVFGFNQVVLSNSAVASLSSLTSLTSLEFPGDWLKTSGAQAIASLANLQSLKIPGAEQVVQSEAFC